MGHLPPRCFASSRLASRPGGSGWTAGPAALELPMRGGLGGGLAILVFFYAPLSDLLIFGFFFTSFFLRSENLYLFFFT